MNTQRVNYAKFVDLINNISNNPYSQKFIPINNYLPVKNCGFVSPSSDLLASTNFIEKSVVPPNRPIQKEQTANNNIFEGNITIKKQNNITLDFNEINKNLEYEIRNAKMNHNKNKNKSENEIVSNKNNDGNNKFCGKIMFDVPRNKNKNFLFDNKKEKINKQEFIQELPYETSAIENNLSFENINSANKILNEKENDKITEKMTGKILFDYPRKKQFSFERYEQQLNFESEIKLEQVQAQKKKVSWDSNIYDNTLVNTTDKEIINVDNKHVNLNKNKIGKNKLYEIENDFEEGISNCMILYQNHVDLYKTTRFALTLDGENVTSCKSNLTSVGDFIHLKITFYSLIGKKKNKKIVYHSLTEYEFWAYENKGKYLIYNLADDVLNEPDIEENPKEPVDTIEQKIIYATSGDICIFAYLYFFIKEGKFMIEFQMNNSYEKFYASNFANINFVKYVQK